MLVPAQDSRDRDVCLFDEADTRDVIRFFNDSGKFKYTRFVFSKTRITRLLDARTPFADLHFDSVKPMAFTPDEKAILKEWLMRGGFLVALEDTYPYEQEEFRKARDLPVFDFFTKELPAEDSDFTVERAGPSDAFFREPYPTRPAAPIEVEMRENPNYRGFTMLLYKGRVAVFIHGRYNYMEDGRWVRATRPFSSDHTLAIESYALTINIYYYALTH